jgi:hypothetical protein
VQFGKDGELQHLTPQKAGGKKEHFESFDFAGLGIQPGDDIISEFFGFLLGIWGTLADIENVAHAVILES